MAEGDVVAEGVVRFEEGRAIFDRLRLVIAGVLKDEVDVFFLVWDVDCMIPVICQWLC